MRYILSHRDGGALIYVRRGRVVRQHWIWIALLALTTLLFVLAKLEGQTGKVVAVSPADAAKARGLHAALKTAEGAWQTFRQRIERDYLTTTDLQAGSNVNWTDTKDAQFSAVSIHRCETAILRVAGTLDEYDSPLCVEWRKQHPPKPQPPPRYKLQGFEDGFEFSQDFRFVVPAAKESAPPCSPWRLGPLYDNAIPLGDTGLRIWR